MQWEELNSQEMKEKGRQDSLMSDAVLLSYVKFEFQGSSICGNRW